MANPRYANQNPLTVSARISTSRVGIFRMAINKATEIRPREITDKKVYLNRRLFMRGAALAATTAATGLLYRKLNPPPAEIPKGQRLEVVSSAAPADLIEQGFTVNEKLTAIEDITNYNNFYEFS